MEDPHPRRRRSPEDESRGVDKDGDLILSRRHPDTCPDRPSDSIVIYHSMATAICLVGLQVWRGALLLADFIFHKLDTTSEFEGVTALELGCGTGLAGIVLARQAKLVFLTDMNDDILDNCSRNSFANRKSCLHGESSVKVRQLDWKQDLPLQGSSKECSSSYLWSESDLKDLDDATILLAADVIYSDELTDAFFSTLANLLSRGSKKVLYLGLEKRYNFSLGAMDVVANGYENFLSYLRAEGTHTLGSFLVLLHFDHVHVVGAEGNRQTAAFTGRRLDVMAIPKCIVEYNRGADLELWEITLADHT